MSEGYRCLGVDLRGYGKSDKPSGEYSYDVLADDVKTVMEAYDVEGATLVGFSMGGGTATRYMGRHEQAHVDRLVLLGAAAPCLIEKEDFPEGLDEGSFDPLIESARADRASMNAGFVEDLFHTDQSEAKKEFLRHVAAEASTYATVACAEMFRDADLQPDLDSITVPTLVCHGTHDGITPFEITGELLGERIENAELVRFENSGHGLNDDEPEKLHEELLAFLE